MATNAQRRRLHRQINRPSKALAKWMVAVARAQFREVLRKRAEKVPAWKDPAAQGRRRYTGNRARAQRGVYRGRAVQ